MPSLNLSVQVINQYGKKQLINDAMQATKRPRLDVQLRRLMSYARQESVNVTINTGIFYSGSGRFNAGFFGFDDG